MATFIRPGIELENDVERLLRDANWTFERGVVIKDARPDFVLTTQNGNQIILEVKDWDASPAARGGTQGKSKSLKSTSVR